MVTAVVNKDPVYFFPINGSSIVRLHWFGVDQGCCILVSFFTARTVYDIGIVIVNFI